MSKRRHNFGTKRFKEKSLFIFHARIALKSLILLFVRLIARGARIGKKTHTHRQTRRTLAHARRGLIIIILWGLHATRKRIACNNRLIKGQVKNINNFLSGRLRLPDVVTLFNYACILTPILKSI